MSEPVIDHILVYGTLCRGYGKAEKMIADGRIEFVKETFVFGNIYDLGWFPGAKLRDNGDTIKCEKFRILDPTVIKELDVYEGYREGDLSSSLFVRTVFGDSFIYEYNHNVKKFPLVESGNWKEYVDERNREAAAA